MKKEDIKPKCQELCDALDAVINQFNDSLPEGCGFLVMSKSNVYGWNGATGKYLQVGMYLNKSVLEQ